MIGIDIGLINAITTSSGLFIKIPYWSAKSLEYVAETVAELNDDIAIEKLNKFKVKYRSLNWYESNPKYLSALIYERVVQKGYSVFYVNSINTSRICSVCTNKGKLNQRLFVCSTCNNVLDRDINAARNIKRIALGEPKVYPEVLKARKFSSNISNNNEVIFYYYRDSKTAYGGV